MCLCNICDLKNVTTSKTSAVVVVVVSAVSTGLSWIMGVNPFYINVCLSLLFVFLSASSVLLFLACQKQRAIFVLPIIIAQTLFTLMLLGLSISTTVNKWSELSTFDNVFYIFFFLCALYLNIELLFSHIRCYRLLLTTNRSQQECTIQATP